MNLSGLLNVLDGIVDTPDRILVMTTNFPDSLDAALIRPGRIDKLIYMGLMKAPEAAQLITHYFPSGNHILKSDFSHTIHIIILIFSHSNPYSTAP